MSEISKERRDTIRRLLDTDKGFDIGDLSAKTLAALLDMADERDRYRALLEEVNEYFDQRADADCEGDPPRFVPDEEMRWKVHIEDELKGS